MPQMISEEGPQSSEEGSGLHSPVFGAPYPTHGDSFRYQDVQQSIGAQYDYGHSLNAQQPPILDIELPNSSSARQVPFPSQYPIPPRNQLGIDFAVQSPVTSRIPSAPQPNTHIDFRYSPTTERRLPGGPSHDHSYTRPSGNSSSMPMEADHRSSLVPSTSARSDASPAAEASTSPRESRKEISSVVIACRQCLLTEYSPVNCLPYPVLSRSRKIRCDSTRPVCNNCVRRSNECEYDLVPKRRGPDKRPGTRQRSLKENLQQEPKRPSPTTFRHLDRHQQDPHYSHIHPHSGQAPPSPTDLRMPSDEDAHYKHDLSTPYRRTPSYMYDQGSYTKSSYPRQLDVNTFQFPDTHHRKFPVPTSPTIETEQKIWWDKIMRTHSLTGITAELTFLVNNTGHLLSFINLTFLIKRLYREDERLLIQPGPIGLQQAMMLANDAHAAFEDALRFQWLDATLAEAALILSLFESSAYPNHSAGRATNVLISLDQLIRNISLTTIDTGDRDVCLFSPNTVPMVLVESGIDEYNKDRKCACLPFDAQEPVDHYSNRPFILPWDPNWSNNEVRDEEIRRLCWSALTLISEFYICDPANFGLLFPGEVLDRVSPAYRASDALSPKESVWGLYCRSMLLWNFCNRFREPSQDEERAEQAHEAFLEVQAIEDSLNVHRCNLDTTLIYTCREYIHNTRMLVAQALRSFHGLENGRTAPGPIFKRKQAEDWLFYEDQVIRRVNALVHQLSSTAAHQLTRRPYRINWFINQLAICLVLWTHDPTLDDALKLAKSILIPIDVLNALWPCPAIQHRCNSLRQQLIEACNSRNIELPFPPEYSVPSFLRS
ncbi:hypothetical protein BDZ97DRAFT_1811637 [Flammula alnicola]|nr:hypothetical protein BDZ97DRAFT_1811637 [Flammula alnicola]